ncbi:MAG: HAD hydrolase-like protein [Ruminococcus sp.]|nr:HAD hydrolase-like protein [Ruminococcus sp.]
MKKYRLIIFDFDGTVADTSEGIFNSIRYVQKMMGLPEITAEQMRSHVGPPMEESYSRNFGLKGEELKRAVEYHKEYAVNRGYRELRIYDGIPELLDRLRSEGYLTAVATLKAQGTVDKIAESFGLKERFDFIAGAAGGATKAELIRKCMTGLGCSPEETLLIGDSEYDAMGAKEAGVGFMAVTYGFGFKEGDRVEGSVGVWGCAGEIWENLK